MTDTAGDNRKKKQNQQKRGWTIPASFFCPHRRTDAGENLDLNRLKQ
jgi:hypothetical protein